MFKFSDLSDKDEEFNAQNHLLTPKKFFEKRRTAKKVYVFDLRSSEDFETSHLPGAHNLPFEHFEDSIYQMPFSGEIMLYGGDEKELFSAAEILYDNGFEIFSFIDSYDSLIGGVDASFIDISRKAQDHIKKILNASSEKIQGVSIIIETKTERKANYSIQFIELSDTPAENISIDFENIPVLVSKEVIPYLEGTEVDLNDKGELEAFNPNMSITEISGSVEEQIQHVLDEEVNPMVASHGGVVSLLEVKDHNAYLEFGGGCQGCGMIDVTLKQGVEVMIKAQIPEIEAIYDVTDHAGGTNPYYQPSAK
jgi:Fe/S biogenesis protein NfuA